LIEDVIFNFQQRLFASFKSIDIVIRFFCCYYLVCGRNICINFGILYFSESRQHLLPRHKVCFLDNAVIWQGIIILVIFSAFVARLSPLGSILAFYHMAQEAAHIKNLTLKKISVRY